MKISLGLLNAARRNLTNFWIGTAARYHRVYGIGYREAPEAVAPHNLQQMIDAKATALRLSGPYPVLEGYCDKSVFVNKEGNWAFRFMHDMTHIAHGLDTSYTAERDVAQIQVKEVRDIFGYNSTEAALTVADTFGQLIHFQSYNDFPRDQLGFALCYLDCYVDEFPRKPEHMFSPKAKDTTYFYDCAEFIRSQGR